MAEQAKKEKNFFVENYSSGGYETLEEARKAATQRMLSYGYEKPSKITQVVAKVYLSTDYTIPSMLEAVL